MTGRRTVVGVFEDRADAQQAVTELRQAGFSDDQIGVTGRDYGTDASDTNATAEAGDSYASEGALTGIAAGAGIGTLWGLAILAGALPAIGPAIAAGSMAALLSSAAAGAAAAGLGGALVGLGVPKDEAEYYESEVMAGRILVTVEANGRSTEALGIIHRCGGRDMSGATGLRDNEAEDSARSASVLDSTDRSDTSALSSGRPGDLSTTGPRSGSRNLDDTDDHIVQAREEQLRVNKQAKQTGEVTVRKEVHTEHQSFEVPVQREEIVIEHRPGSGQTAQGTIGDRNEIRVPVSEEQVQVEKETVVKGEVAVGKRRVQDTQHVEGTVRSEDIEVDSTGDVDIRERRKP